MSGRFDDHRPGDGHDTAGVPWAGRMLSGTGFDADDGEMDPGLRAALSQPEHEEQLVAAVSRARLIVPIVAVPGDGASDMSSVTVSAPDGTRALLAFSGIAALSAWDTSARPVPVSAQRTALAAVQERCDVVVLDIGSPGTVTLRSSMVWALAMDRAWRSAHGDAVVRSAVATACAGEPAIAGWELSPGEHGELVVTLAVLPGFEAGQVQSAVQALAERIAGDGEARARIDAIRFRIRKAR
ncbi:SseB family protein [soil metagenome]